MRNDLLDRRALLAGIATTLAAPAFARAAPSAVQAIAFDGFPIFDPRSVTAKARAMLGDRGDALAAQWSAKLFGYSWLETAAGRYQDFRTLADAALNYTSEAMNVSLPRPMRDALVGAYDELGIWPDVKPALMKLRAAGVRLAFLSNLGAGTLSANMERNGIADFFEPSLSTDRVRHFKPSPLAYGMALAAFRLHRTAIGFAAFGGWDAAGATWFGYRTAWVNRLALPVEPLDVRPAIVSRGMDGVLALAGLT